MPQLDKASEEILLRTITGFRRLAAGYVQCSLRPTTKGPQPKAYNNSVAEGKKEQILKKAYPFREKARALPPEKRRAARTYRARKRLVKRLSTTKTRWK